MSTAHHTTPRGAATRARIVDAAAELFHAQGVDATGLDDVLAAGQAGKSQLYHYFGDRDGLVSAVIDVQAERVVAWHTALLAQARTVADLQAWADRVVGEVEATGTWFGCPLGSLAAQLTDRPVAHRDHVVAGFGHWEQELTTAVERVTAGRPTAAGLDAADHAAVLLTALQGGLLLAHATHDVRHLRLGLHAALAGLTPAPARGPARSRPSGGR